MFLFVVILTIFLAWIEVPSLIRKKQWRELAVFAGLLLAVLGLGIVQKLQLPVSNLTQGLDQAVKPVTEFVLGKK